MNEHLIEYFENSEGNKVTTNLLVNDDIFFKVVDSISVSFGATYFQANHGTTIKGNEATTKAGEFVKYHRIMTNDEALDIIKNIDKYSPKVLEQLCNACFRRSSFTSEFCQDYISVETHRDGWYIIVEGLRSKCCFFLNKNYEVIRKPRGSKALYKTAVSNCSYFNWRTLLDMKNNNAGANKEKS